MHSRLEPLLVQYADAGIPEPTPEGVVTAIQRLVTKVTVLSPEVIYQDGVSINLDEDTNFIQAVILLMFKIVMRQGVRPLQSYSDFSLLMQSKQRFWN